MIDFKQTIIETIAKATNMEEQEIKNYIDVPKDMKNGDFTEEQIENEKKGIISQINSIEDEQDTSIIYFFGQELTSSNESLNEYKQNINKVTKEDVLKIAQKIRINTVYFLRN